MYKFLDEHKFLFFLEKKFRSGISGSYSKWMFNFVRNCQTVTQQHCMTFDLPASSPSLGVAVFFFFFYLIYSTSCVSVTSLIPMTNSCLQWQRLRSYKSRSQLHICLDGEIHAWLHTSPTCHLPLCYRCCCLSPALDPVFKFTTLQVLTLPVPGKDQDRDKGARHLWTAIRKDTELLHLISFLTEGDKAISCLEHT